LPSQLGALATGVLKAASWPDRGFAAAQPPCHDLVMALDSRPQLHIRLEPDGVAAPAMNVATSAARVVGTCLNALDHLDFDDPALTAPFCGFDFRAADVPIEERREACSAWLVAKGFQDLAKGVRESLEEAFVYCAIVAGPPPVPSLDGFHAWLEEQKRTAARPNFPDLLAAVNARLREPLSFEAEFLSIQRARNCLEHRRGIVGQKDFDQGGNRLTLTFPRMKTYFIQDNEEIELRPGVILDRGEDPAKRQPAEVFMRRETRSLHFEQGGRLQIDARDFAEIAFSCHLFASDLATKLPQAPVASPPG
jgi:hypothetical protein